jgi:hypothetical protein
VLCLYDPRTNILTETNYMYLVDLTGMKRSHLATNKAKKSKITKINCYLTDNEVTLKQRKIWYELQSYHNETWKTIHGSNGRFLVSNYGRFKRVYKKHTGYLLPFLRKESGYLQIKVMFNGKYGTYKISNLVALHFVGGPKPGEVVFHKNGIITDDFSGNLEYISKSSLGKKTGFKSKSKAVVQLDIHTLDVLEEYRSAREAGRKNYISYQAVLDNCNHKTKVCCGNFLFMFADEYEEIEGAVN